MLRDDILAAFPNLTAANRDDAAIATQLSIGRTKTVSKVGGIGVVLKTLGPTAGAAFLDAVSTLAQTNSVVKWGLQMIENGTFDFGDPLAVAQAETFTQTNPPILTTDQANALIALGVVPDPITPAMVAEALAGYTYGA